MGRYNGEMYENGMFRTWSFPGFTEPFFKMRETYRQGKRPTWDPSIYIGIRERGT